MSDNEQREGVAETVAAPRIVRRRSTGANRRTDGHDTGGVVVDRAEFDRLTALETQVKTRALADTITAANTAGAPNSALKEAATPNDEYRINHPAAARVRILDRERGVVAPSGRKQFAICGFAGSTRAMVPVNDPTWEVWGLNQLYRHLPRADRWFDIHWNWDKETVPGTDYRGWVKDCGIPFYMIGTQPDLPTTVRFPIERLMQTQGADYFTSTIAFMLALAVDEIDQAVDRRVRAGELQPAASLSQALQALYAEYAIAIFGVDLVVGEEYFWQKACAEYWCGVASGKGIRVIIPPQSALCKQLYRYGYEAEPQSLIKQSEVEKHAKMLTDKRTECMQQLYMLDGALQVDEYWKQVLELRLRGSTVAVS